MGDLTEIYSGSHPPSSLADLVRVWDAGGRCPPDPVLWDFQRWVRFFPPSETESGVLATLPRQLMREAGIDLGSRAASSPSQALEAFMFAMAWGFGTTNYGAYRTRKIIEAAQSSSCEFAEQLRDVAEAVRRDGGVEGYRILANEGRLKWLGPAFATKYLYFVSGPGKGGALILDRLVADWLEREVGFLVNPTRWSTPRYRDYIYSMQEWSSALGVDPGDLEALIFEEERRARSESTRFDPK